MTQDIRDQRDPEKLGGAYLALRARGVSTAVAASVTADRYDGSGFMSSNPAEHHQAHLPKGTLSGDEDLSV